MAINALVITGLDPGAVPGGSTKFSLLAQGNRSQTAFADEISVGAETGSTDG